MESPLKIKSAGSLGERTSLKKQNNSKVARNVLDIDDHVNASDLLSPRINILDPVYDMNGKDDEFDNFLQRRSRPEKLGSFSYKKQSPFSKLAADRGFATCGRNPQ